jgi:succinate dehydrogenase / fumarate reductase iron-sulfur subunit
MLQIIEIKEKMNDSNRDKGKDERLKIVDDSHGIWRCHFAGSCSQVCPKGVDPAMGIQLLRGYLLGFRS